MIHGFINVLKPPGMTSSDVVVTLRRLLPKGARVGHAGTLDPEAAGVLPIMVGKAARLFAYLVDKEKAYVAALRLGAVTDTRDAQGAVLDSSPARPTDAEIRAVLPRFVGTIWQTPPVYSALKRHGKPLYALARAGEDVQVEPRQVTINAITMERRLSEDEALLSVRCGKGTYIRSLCHDIGQELGCGGHMGFLLRTQSGIFTLENACALEALRSADELAARLLPMDAPIQHLTMVRVLPTAREACLNGNPLRANQLEGGLPQSQEPQRVYVGQDFAGIGRRRGDTLAFDAMLLERENK
ncbi:MAG: tRNA pseudouridine(55) synthase TruB [Clostridia bacterium]|nr:tRNA pseudouridine(55) synthase TruB [Clostridia bacterium]